MRTVFPTAVKAVYMGVARNAGEFPDRDTGEVISYGKNHLFAFESAEGVTQTLTVSEKDLDQVRGFKIDSIKKFSEVAIHGEVTLNTGKGARSYFRLLGAEAGSAVNAGS